MEKFDDIVEKVLAACEGLDDTQIEAALQKILEEEGFNDEEKAFVNETFALLDSSAAQYDNLQEAKKNGIGRQEWLTYQFDKMLEGRDEEEVNTVMKTIEKATETNIEDELDAAEKEIDTTEEEK